MFELTNEQRKFFALAPVLPRWDRIELGLYGQNTIIAYLDGNEIKKFIETGEKRYIERELSECVSEDRKYLLPKTAKGKPVLLTAASLVNRKGRDMSLTFVGGGTRNINLFSFTSEKDYYDSHYDRVKVYTIEDFARWVDTWCEESTEEDIADLERFAALPRQHVKFKEGDVFRFKLSRRLYGYGRILVDYAAMRKKKIPFWDCFMGKPLVCSAYHIVTERSDMTVDELKHLKSLPSDNMMDNMLFYGTYEIIGNIPIGESEDYPIVYGHSLGRERAVYFQCGKLFLRDDTNTNLFENLRFVNSAQGFHMKFNLSLLKECIEAGSNEPYWALQNKVSEAPSSLPRLITHDLRNPKYRNELEAICKQFDISPEMLIKE